MSNESLQHVVEELIVMLVEKGILDPGDVSIIKQRLLDKDRYDN